MECRIPWMALLVYIQFHRTLCQIHHSVHRSHSDRDRGQHQLKQVFSSLVQLYQGFLHHQHWSLPCHRIVLDLLSICGKLVIQYRLWAHQLFNRRSSESCHWHLGLHTRSQWKRQVHTGASHLILGLGHSVKRDSGSKSPIRLVVPHSLGVICFDRQVDCRWRLQMHLEGGRQRRKFSFLLIMITLHQFI